MKKTHILTFLILIFLSGPVSAETLYIPYSGFVYNATGEIWCVRQSVFQLSTGEGFAEYDRGIDKCVVTLVLDSHKEPAEITSVDLAITSIENEYNATIIDLKHDVKMKSFWIWFIVIFGGMINFIVIGSLMTVIYIYPTLRFR